MTFRNRLTILFISLMVMLCFTCAHYTYTKVFPSDKVKKERAVSQITQYIKDENVRLEEDELKTIAQIVYEESKLYGVDYRLVLAMMKVESNFRNNMVSPRGARGLLQIKPSLAKFIAKDVGIKWGGAKTLNEPDTNIKIGVHFFSKLMEDFDNINMALHAYNMGPTRLKEILSEKNKPKNTFLNLVLKEYNKNILILPAP
ncbi:MAG: lytic transglycosylase domain-containing protein [Proteobacteria bacterium]|nr:lytic transglycosylase domain-containing protein [Pseudomonadota bacterium]